MRPHLRISKTFLRNPATSSRLIPIAVAGGRRVFVGLWVCYHDNSKLPASIFTKLGL